MSNQTKLELCNVSKVAELIENGILDDKEITQLTKYIKKVKNIGDDNIGKVEVDYKKSIGSKGKGRLYARGGLSLQSFKKGIRHYLADDIYWDVDMVNAHPVILLKICQNKGFCCNYIKQYVDNREFYINELMELTQCGRKQIKELYLSTLNLKDPNRWCIEYGILTELPEHIIGFYNECKKIALNLWESEKELKKIVETKKIVENHPNKQNKYAQLLSHYLQIEENEILRIICDKFDDLEYEVDVLVFDGCMVRKCDKNINEALTECEDAIQDATGYDIKLLVKAMNEPLTLEEDDFDLDEFEIPPERKLKWDKSYLLSLKNKKSQNTYLMRKKYNEVFSAKVLRPKPMYVVFEKGASVGDIDILTDSDMKERLKGIPSGIKNVAGKDISFYEVWTEDPEQLQYNRFAFHPYNVKDEQEPPDIYNLFKGFSPYIDYPYNPDERDTLLKPFFKLTNIMADNNPDVYNYLIHYIANIVKKPRDRPPVIIILNGNQGTGKSLWVKAVRFLVGLDLSISSSKIKDFVGDHSEGFYRKLFVNINESEGKDMFQHLGKIKEFVSEKEITINPKHLRPFKIENFAYMVVNSNSDNPFVLDVKSKERRVVMQRVSDEWLNKSTNFWEKMWEYFERPDFISALYDYLMSVDVENFDFRKRPITKAYIDLVRLYRPSECLWFQNFIQMCKWNMFYEDEDDLYIPNKKEDDPKYETSINLNMKGMYDDFKLYTKEHRLHDETKTPSFKSFENKIRSLHLPLDVIRTQSGVVKIKFCPKDVYDYMEKNNLIDDENTNYSNFFGDDNVENNEFEEMFGNI